MTATTPDTRAIAALRRRGVASLAILGWASLAVVALVHWLLIGPAWWLLLVGVAVNVAPTAMAIARRHDAQARLVVGTLAAAMPALLTYALRGHAWQMDSHMYFFVALAALTVLCDWRPLALASGLIAAHHLALEWLAPAWVFEGDGNLGRVLFHAGAVVLQFVVLADVTARLARLLRAQDDAMSSGARLVAAEQDHRTRAQDALAQMQVAEAQAERTRRDGEAIERRHADARRRELLALAADFERSVATIAVAIEGATDRLEASAVQLDDLSGAAGREARDVAANAFDTAGEIHRVAGAMSALGRSIGSIAAAAEQQRGLTAVGRDKGERSAATIAALDGSTAQIGAFTDEIRAIATKTNLLALNATIEAARAGEAGRGFAVVATEVKGLAAETARASDRITDILAGVRRTVDASVQDAGTVNRTVAEVSQAAAGIAAEAADQRLLAGEIEDSATRVSGNANRIEQRIGELAASVADANALSASVRGSSAALSGTARELRQSVDRFIRHLRDDTTHRHVA